MSAMAMKFKDKTYVLPEPAEDLLTLKFLELIMYLIETLKYKNMQED